MYGVDIVVDAEGHNGTTAYVVASGKAEAANIMGYGVWVPLVAGRADESRALWQRLRRRERRSERLAGVGLRAAGRGFAAAMPLPRARTTGRQIAMRDCGVLAHPQRSRRRA
jgi:hypothetical protein